MAGFFKASLSAAIQPHMTVIPIRCLSDNYAYLLVDGKTMKAAAVDPVEPEKVLSVAKKSKLQVEAVLITHHHYDHSGGNSAFVKMSSGVKVYGGDSRIPEITDTVKHKQHFLRLGNISLVALATPCHTRGSISYYAQHDTSGERAVFTGDTMFISGCGRFFEGTAQEMKSSLLDVICSLPPDTKVYCGHEYTKKNLQFALKVEPGNALVREKLSWAQDAECTVPSTLEDELNTNPFLRIKSKEIMKSLNLPESAQEVDVMAALRTAKDNF